MLSILVDVNFDVFFRIKDAWHMGLEQYQKKSHIQVADTSAYLHYQSFRCFDSVDDASMQLAEYLY